MACPPRAGYIRSCTVPYAKSANSEVLYCVLSAHARRALHPHVAARPDGTGSGWAARRGRLQYIIGIDAAALDEVAADKALNSVRKAEGALSGHLHGDPEPRPARPFLSLNDVRLNARAAEGPQLH